jgi:hypothetical protein
MTAHADLIRRAREHAETLERTGCGTQAGLYRELADALEQAGRSAAVMGLAIRSAVGQLGTGDEPGETKGGAE